MAEACRDVDGPRLEVRRVPVLLEQLGCLLIIEPLPLLVSRAGGPSGQVSKILGTLPMLRETVPERLDALRAPVDGLVRQTEWLARCTCSTKIVKGG